MPSPEKQGQAGKKQLGRSKHTLSVSSPSTAFAPGTDVPFWSPARFSSHAVSRPPPVTIPRGYVLDVWSDTDMPGKLREKRNGESEAGNRNQAKEPCGTRAAGPSLEENKADSLRFPRRSLPTGGTTARPCGRRRG